jgi:hypothetical protein
LKIVAGVMAPKSNEACFLERQHPSVQWLFIGRAKFVCFQ